MIYFDNAATTKPEKFCEEIYTYCSENYYNPSALYSKALDVHKRIQQARETILKTLHGEGSFIFTSSGTESANLAVFGSKKPKSGTYIFSTAEHPAVLKSALELKQRGYNVIFAEVDTCGRVIYDEYIKLIGNDTAFISVMHVNNETGGINDIKRLCADAKKINSKIIFHSDGVQALGKTKIDLNDLGVDLYSVSAHKIHALKGCGGLYVKKGVSVNPIIFGGGQEFGLRSSTENVLGILCFAEAVSRLANTDAIENKLAIMQTLRQYIANELVKDGKALCISDENCSPFVISVAMKYIRGEVMLHALEQKGILVGTGSACSSSKKDLKPWKLKNLPQEYKDGILRLSFGKDNTIDEAKEFIEAFCSECTKLSKYIRG